MKSILLILVSVSFLLSCNSKEKFQGRWSNYMQKYSDYDNEIRSVIINNDSITFKYPYFDYSNSYPLSIENGRFKFNNLSISAIVQKDTLSLNDSIYFVKDQMDTIYGSDILLEIDLPKITDLITQKLNKENLNTYIHFGKRIVNQNYVLQLNDIISSISDLPYFVFRTNCHNSIDYSKIAHTVLSMDKSSTLNHFEEIIYSLTSINYLNLDLVNDIHLPYNDSLGFNYDYEILPKKLQPFRESDNYRPNEKELPPPPPPPPYNPIFEDKNLISKFIYLKKDKLYFENQIISTSKLKSIVKPWIENNNVIFSPYDLESTYGIFLEMNAIINSGYLEVREQVSQKKFNLSLQDLSMDQLNDIKMQIRMNHVWSFSIPHYNHIVENNGSFFGLKVP